MRMAGSRTLISPAIHAEMRLIVAHMKNRAARGTWDGRRHPVTDLYFRSCIRDHNRTGSRLIFTRDTGHHASGWFKNPDYERCLHLSMSSYDPQPAIWAPGDPPVGTGSLDWKVARLWAELFFGAALPKVWIESPKSAAGKERDVWHWRLFCDERWQPILPRGEVYSLEFTEKGWKSYSQLREETGVEILSPLNPHPE
jgi:hypothetical protein